MGVQLALHAVGSSLSWNWCRIVSRESMASLSQIIWFETSFEQKTWPMAASQLPPSEININARNTFCFYLSYKEDIIHCQAC